MTLILLTVLAAAACGRTPAARATVAHQPPLPPTSGTLTVASLMQPVHIVRDRWGVPHITAADAHDLFLAQGFVQAQDRLFQMDLWRRSVQGRLSEVLGPNFIDRDAMTRRMQYHGDSAVEWARYGPDARSIADAFVTGINAWVVVARQDPPQEFLLAGWRPELWKPDDLLNRTDAFLSSADADVEAFRLRLIAAVGRARADELLPGDTPGGLVADMDLDQSGSILGDALRRAGTTPFFSGFASPFSGSNAWAFAASRSATGAPLLANDPHRPLTSPSLRYLVHLRAPGWNVIGATAPWLPGVAIGHNEHVAWGMAAHPADTQDLHVEDAGAVIARINDPIVVKGEAKPFAFAREYTRIGVVIASDRAHHRVFTLSWKGFEPGAAAELGSLALDRASTALDLRDRLLARWKMPSVDIVSADASGLGSATPVAIAANDNVARTGRLTEMFAGAMKYTVEDVKRQQHDTVSWNAEQIVPRLASLRPSNAGLEQARRDLLGWDKRVTSGSRIASLYVLWEQSIWRKIAESRVPAALVDDFLARVPFDASRARTASDRVLLEALASALERLQRQGVSERRVLFRHPLAITQASRALFDVGPFVRDGYSDTVLSFATRVSTDVGPSFREIIDVADWDRSVVINAPGQSEWPRSVHFSDLAKLWASEQYFPLVFSDRAIRANAETTLILRPR